jgi:hypothetical protein
MGTISPAGEAVTSDFRITLRNLGLTTGEFSLLTGESYDTLAKWGRRKTPYGAKQAEPAWAWALLRAWLRDPGALEAERKASRPSETRA